MANGQFDTTVQFLQYDPATDALVYDPGNDKLIVRHRCPTGDCGPCTNSLDDGAPADYDSPVGYCITFVNVRPRGDYAVYGGCYCDTAVADPPAVTKRYLFNDFNRTWWAGTFVDSHETGGFQFCTHMGKNVAGDAYNVTGTYGWSGSTAIDDCAAHTAPADPQAGDVPQDFGFSVSVSRDTATGRRFLNAVGGFVVSDGVGGETVGPGVFYGYIELTEPGCAADAGYVVPNQMAEERYPCPVLGATSGSFTEVTGWTAYQTEPDGCADVPCTERALVNGDFYPVNYVQNVPCQYVVDGSGALVPVVQDPVSGFHYPCVVSPGGYGVGGYAFVKGRTADSVPDACADDVYICVSIWTKRYNCFTQAWESTSGPDTFCAVGFEQGWQLIGTTEDPAGAVTAYRTYLAVTSAGTCGGVGAACDDGDAPADPDFTPTGCPECSDCADCGDDIAVHYLVGGVEHCDVISKDTGDCHYVGTSVIVDCVNGVRVMTITSGSDHATFHSVDPGGGCLLLTDDAWYRTEDTTSGGVTLRSGTFGEYAATCCTGDTCPTPDTPCTDDTTTAAIAVTFDDDVTVTYCRFNNVEDGLTGWTDVDDPLNKITCGADGIPGYLKLSYESGGVLYTWSSCGGCPSLTAGDWAPVSQRTVPGGADGPWDGSTGPSIASLAGAAPCDDNCGIDAVTVSISNPGECDDGQTVVLTYDAVNDAWLSPSTNSYLFWDGAKWQLFISNTDFPPGTCDLVIGCGSSEWTASTGDANCPPLSTAAYARTEFSVCGDPSLSSVTAD